MRNNQRAFTLVELSIVLVILGLLIGGVLTGQSLIRAAELRSVSTQYSRYVTAVQTFRDKYFALPGDMTNATSYWGIAAGSTGNDATCQAASTGTTATCNGDGNGQIGTAFAATSSNERFRFWQHLANAGLIEGNYSGISHGAYYYSAIAGDGPAGRISSSYWYALNWGTSSAFAQMFDGQYDNTLQFGGLMANADPDGAIFKPEEAYNIDTKMDDGKPATGKLVVRHPSSLANCTDTASTTTLTANYLLSSTALGCALEFRQVF